MWVTRTRLTCESNGRLLHDNLLTLDSFVEGDVAKFVDEKNVIFHERVAGIERIRETAPFFREFGNDNPTDCIALMDVSDGVERGKACLDLIKKIT